MTPCHFYYNNFPVYGDFSQVIPSPYPSEERQFGGFPTFFPTQPQNPEAAPPSGPPPAFVPNQAQTFAVDPGSIRRCLFRFTYVWLRSGQPFWFYPIFVGRTSVAGYRWTGFRWAYSGISLRQIQTFTCV